MDEPSTVNGLTWLVANENWVRRMCSKMCTGHAEMHEDAWSICVDRCTAVFGSYDAAKGCLDRHMRVGLRWYLFKWARYRRPRELRELTMDVARSPEVADRASFRRDQDDLEAQDEAQHLMSVLSDEERSIVELYVVNDYTFSEIGDHLGMSKNAVRKRFYGALGKARAKAEG